MVSTRHERLQLGKACVQEALISVHSSLTLQRREAVFEAWISSVLGGLNYTEHFVSFRLVVNLKYSLFPSISNIVIVLIIIDIISGVARGKVRRFI